MITKLISVALAVAMLACGVMGIMLWFTSSDLETALDDNARLTRNAAVLEDQAAQARLAADVADASRQRIERLNADANATIEAIRNLQLGECADAPLDPALTDLLGRR